MGLETDLQEAIDKNLTNEVASRLRERLEQAELDSRGCISLAKEVKKLTEECEKWHSLSLSEDRNQEKEKELRNRQIKLTIEEVTVDVQKECMKRRNEDIFRLASIVFDNPK